ncbi:hypothetical protein C8R45DRAFT_1185370 [Mycena sanguinolenta]|nr:hypothetical protein C8R45DRAFT_1185370 [Mycena sanguinolenta]
MQKKIFLPLLSAVSAATAAELVTNGGFETGVASPWVIGGGGSAHVTSNSDSSQFLPLAAHSRTHFLTISCENADEPTSELSNDGFSAATTISQEHVRRFGDAVRKPEWQLYHGAAVHCAQRYICGACWVDGSAEPGGELGVHRGEFGGRIWAGGCFVAELD